MALNIVWFGTAYCQFSFRSAANAGTLLTQKHRQSPLVETIAYSLRFLGAMNFAFAVLCALVLSGFGAFTSVQTAWLVAIVSVAHAGQFACNLAIAVGVRGMPLSERPGLFGLMRKIFIVDGVLMSANGLMSLWLTLV